MRLALLLVLSAALLGTASAQLFPPVPQQGTVYDGASLLSADEESWISQTSREFQRNTGAPIVVATLPSLDKMDAQAMGIERYSTALFNQWRIGSRNANGGILLVVSKADRKARIELGRDWRHDYDAQAQKVLRETILPAFKRGQYGVGIVQGCEALSQLTEPLPAAGPIPGDQGPFAPPMDSMPGAPPGSGDALGGLVCVGVPVLLVVLAISFAARRRSRYGSSYGTPGTTAYNAYDDPRDDSGAFLTGMVAGQIMSQPVYDPNPFDDGMGYDPGLSSDSGGGFDAGGFDSGSFDSGSFDSGDSGGGGASGDW